ncbi:MAG: apolipoprotein N-acyltransferase [Chthonomonas sp.]|nr:apolipoprotein N-acyltransferase [Chthonomonas sp.]
MKVSASLVRAWPAALSALLLALTYWPANLALLTFVGLVPWLWSLKQPDVNWKRNGAIFALLYFAYQMSWLLFFAEKWTNSFALAAIPYTFTVVAHVPFIIFLAFLIRRCYERNWLWGIPFVWASVEFIRASLPFLAFPHALLATPLAVAPNLIQTASLGTVFMVSAWVALINVVLVELFDRANPRQNLALAGIALALGLFSVDRHSQLPIAKTKVVTIGQLGEDMAFGNQATETARIATAVEKTSAEAELQGAQLLVMPEGLAPGGYDPENPDIPFALPSMPSVFGLQRASDGKVFQSAFGFDGKWSHVDKTKLVIFGEYVPFREILPAFNLPTLDLHPGSKVGTMTIDGTKIAPMICFEGMFYEVAQQQALDGAQLIALMSIDDWYMDTGMPRQLWNSAVFRSVESGLPLVRAASLGYSGWIDARGNVRAMLPLRERRTLRAEVPIPSGSDAFPYRGFFPYLCLLISAFVWLWPRKTGE